MPINTKAVQGRRELRFDSLDDVVADAERVVGAAGVRTLGNWPPDRLLGHLTTAINGSIDGMPFRAPWYIRLIAPRLKRRFTTRKMSPGFKLPKQVEASYFPASPSNLEALAKLKAAVARTKTERMTADHPALGKLNHEEWTQLHLRHAELHLSYVVVQEQGV
jgi:Protein of unknown function (DUF1569)